MLKLLKDIDGFAVGLKCSLHYEMVMSLWEQRMGTNDILFQVICLSMKWTSGRLVGFYIAVNLMGLKII